MPSWNRGPNVLAALALLVAAGAEAAQPPGVQDVHVTNETLPVSVADEVDVFVSNESLEVVVDGSVGVTGATGGPVLVTSADGLIPWTHRGNLPDAEGGTSQCLNGTNPFGYLFVVEQISMQVVSDGRVRSWVSTSFQSIDGVHEGTFYLPLTDLGPIGALGQEEYVINESVTIYATDLCLLVSIDEGPLPGSFIDYTLSGRLVPNGHLVP